ncbi:MAG: hypothetical protein C4334_04410 [Pyrinomonas sp.]|uniref:hypothetical protein n=1 Tax=Pyrinomonas sp. TaxID=2080306 RepID=UPI0033316250
MNELKAQAQGGKEIFYLLGGAALVLLGARLILRHPLIKGYLEQIELGDLVKGVAPDLERYLRLRAM